jgi:hypothetical protein
MKILKSKGDTMFKPPEYDSKKKLKGSVPEMWVSEIRFIEGLLKELSGKKKVLRVLEWGSGNGTIYFAKYLKRKGISFTWTAIEHFIPWFEKVVVMFEKNQLNDSVKCYLMSPTYETDKLKQEKQDLKDYINFPKTQGIKYDLILIDGRRREDCLKVAADSLSSEGTVIMHDAEREWYLKHRNLFRDSGKIVITNVSRYSRGGVQKLWVGRKKAK